MANISLVELSPTELQLTLQNSSLIPRIGERISIHEKDGGERSYRVQDVVWSFDTVAVASHLKMVKLRVVGEDTAENHGL